MCGLHGTSDKPFGCIASPFTLNANDTMIVRNRYRALKCFKAEGAIEAYKAHAGSLRRIFGEEEAARITAHLDAGGGDLEATMPHQSYRMLHDNDAAKHGGRPSRSDGVEWLTGDSRTVVPTIEREFDLVMSCPPYADLELYSDDPADISNMPYEQFMEAYRAIIAASCAKLKPNRFAVWVIGEVRGPGGGECRGLVPDTIRAFKDAGLELYNDAILVTSCGSLPLRVGRQFVISRKLGRTHQYVLVFVKGDPRQATADCGPVVIDEESLVQLAKEQGIEADLPADEIAADQTSNVEPSILVPSS
jgi:hypothetical protein